MTNFKQYFRSHLKANIRAIIYILAVVLVLSFLLGVNLQPRSRYDREIKANVIYDYYSTLYVPVIFLCILAYVLPVMEFSFFKKRINLDCAYSLPISRRAMGAVHYLTGLMILLGAFTASYLLNFLLMLSRGPGWFDFAPMISHYFLCLLLGSAMYSVMVFVFNEANTRGDGIWFMALYTFVFVLTISAIATIADNRNISDGAYVAIPWGLIDTLTTYYQRLVELNKNVKDTFWGSVQCVCWLVGWVVMGIAAAADFFRTFGKRRMEKTEELSDSYLGFRTLIPIFAVTGMIVFTVWDSIILWVIIELFAILGYTIYRRGFHYKKSDIAILCAMLIFLFL